MDCLEHQDDECSGHELEPVKCDLQKFEGYYTPSVVSNQMVLFTHEETQVEIDCGDRRDQKEVKTISGRTILELDPGCVVKSAKWIVSMPALKGPKVVVKAKSFDIRNLKDLVTAPRPQLNNSVVANLTSELVGARESMANLTSGLSELEDEHEAVAVDLDELEQGYEDVVSNMTRNVQEIKKMKNEVRGLHEETRFGSRRHGQC